MTRERIGMDLNVRHTVSSAVVLLLTSIVSSFAGEYLEKVGMAKGYKAAIDPAGLHLE
jgi:hypothetical protein